MIKRRQNSADHWKLFLAPTQQVERVLAILFLKSMSFSFLVLSLTYGLVST